VSINLTINSTEINEWIKDASDGEKFPLARLISLIERKDSLEWRKLLFTELDKLPQKDCITVGITGSPGAGKSSLLGEICREFLLTFSASKRMAIVAIDPSSNLSGGSILGDRTRVVIPARENRIFFRSQASQLELGGVNPYTYHVIRLLRYFFDIIFIETVGIGQNEIEVSKLVDFSFLVMQPLAGDQIQFMKSGIMEVPDAFIINKCDEIELANTSFHTLQTSLEFLKDILGEKAKAPEIFKTSVTKRLGIEELMNFILTIPPAINKNEETYKQILKWIKNEYGNQGMHFIQKNISFTRATNFKYEELEEKIIGIMSKVF
jgi:LAO/AO transport system ATPase